MFILNGLKWSRCAANVRRPRFVSQHPLCTWLHILDASILADDNTPEATTSEDEFYNWKSERWPAFARLDRDLLSNNNIEIVFHEDSYSAPGLDAGPQKSKITCTESLGSRFVRACLMR